MIGLRLKRLIGQLGAPRRGRGRGRHTHTHNRDRMGNQGVVAIPAASAARDASAAADAGVPWHARTALHKAFALCAKSLRLSRQAGQRICEEVLNLWPQPQKLDEIGYTPTNTSHGSGPPPVTRGK